MPKTYYDVQIKPDVRKALEEAGFKISAKVGKQPKDPGFTKLAIPTLGTMKITRGRTERGKTSTLNRFLSLFRSSSR